jgi:uncharacterized membrane protein SirB2
LRLARQTALSQAIQATSWVVPTVQTVHILSVAVVITSALMLDLRLIGVVGVDQPLDRVWARFLPFVWWPLLILLATGAIMIIDEPARSLKNPVFQLKMALLLGAMIVTGIVQLLGRNLSLPEHRPGVSSYLIVALSLLLWTGIVFAGRWIAYWS